MAVASPVVDPIYQEDLVVRDSTPLGVVDLHLLEAFHSSVNPPRLHESILLV